MGSKKTSNFKQSLRVFFGRGLLVKICLGIIFLFVFAAVFAPVLTQYTPYEQDLTLTMAKPSQTHLLGTDNLGRDLLTRLIYGARISMVTSLMASLLGAAVGCTLGLLAGYFEGLLGGVIMRLVDAQLSIPTLILTMVFAMIIGQSIPGMAVVLAIGSIPGYVRVVNGMVLSIKSNDYVTAAMLVGQRERKMIFKHLLPNCFASIIVIFTMSLGTTIMVESSLSYLGVGIAPPTPAWGCMVSEGFKYLTTQPRLALLPGFCVMLIVISFNIVGDGLRDALDPRLRGKL